MRHDSDTRGDEEEEDGDEEKDDEDSVSFESFYLKRFSHIIADEQTNSISLCVERNLEGELSHSSPDWQVHSTLSSLSFRLDVEQYKLLRGLLAQNIGEQVEAHEATAAAAANMAAAFIVRNNELETVLTGRLWKNVGIRLDLLNVGIELMDGDASSLAHFSFERSSLVFESNSDGSKLVDLVSNEILIVDRRSSTSLTVFNYITFFY